MSAGEAPAPAPPASPPAAKGKPSRGRKIAVWVLVALATIIAFASSLTIWVRRQALDTNAVTNAASNILADDAVRSKLSVYLVDQLYNNTNVAQDLSARLPSNLQPIAAPLAGALRQLAVQTADQLLQRPRVQQLFTKAVHDAHAAFVRIIDDKAPLVQSEGENVYLNLRPVLDQLANQYGVLKRVQGKLPPDAGKIRIMSKSQLDAIQTGARVLKSVTVFLGIAVFLLYAIAIYLAKGFRRSTLRNVGVSLAVVGVLLLLVRRVAGNMVVDSLASGPGNHTPGRHIWLIATSLLSDIAWALIGYGLLVVIAAILAGPTRPAVWLRKTLAPTFREHVGLVYVVVGILYLLLLLWAPTRLQTEWIPAIVFAALIVVGVEVFRRQTISEFPEKGAT